MVNIEDYKLFQNFLSDYDYRITFSIQKMLYNEFLNYCKDDCSADQNFETPVSGSWGSTTITDKKFWLFVGNGCYNAVTTTLEEIKKSVDYSGCCYVIYEFVATSNNGPNAVFYQPVMVVK